jgi:membrane dipeptidase
VIIDLHQDLLLHVQRPELYTRLGQTSFEQVDAAPLHAVVATAWPEPANHDYFDSSVPGLIDAGLRDYHAVAHERGWRIADDASDLARDGSTLILHLEGLNVLPDEDPLSQLDAWRAAGVRSMGLTWNASNRLAGGAADATRGLTPLGRNVLTWCAREHVIVDFAHLAPASFWEALDLLAQPPLVSHCGCAAVTQSARNISDEQIRAVAAADGVVGIALVPAFVSEAKRATVDDVVRHITHVAGLVGLRHVALGSDLGGITGAVVSECGAVAELPVLWEALSRAGLGTADIEAVAGANALRILGCALA